MPHFDTGKRCRFYAKIGSFHVDYCMIFFCEFVISYIIYCELNTKDHAVEHCKLALEHAFSPSHFEFKVSLEIPLRKSWIESSH